MKMKKLFNLICLFILTMFIINCKEVNAEEKWICSCDYYASPTGSQYLTIGPVVIPAHPGSISISFNRENEPKIDLIGTNYLTDIKIKRSDLINNYDLNTGLNGRHGCPTSLYAVNTRLYLSKSEADNENKSFLKEVWDFATEHSTSYTLINETCHPENDTNPPDSTSDDPTITEINDCVTLLGSPKTEGTPAYYVSVAFRVVKYVAVGLLIVLSTIDFISAIMSQDKEILNKTITKVVKRFVLCVVIFILPTILDLVLQYINDSQYLEQVKLGLCGIGE